MRCFSHLESRCFASSKVGGSFCALSGRVVYSCADRDYLSIVPTLAKDRMDPALSIQYLDDLADAWIARDRDVNCTVISARAR